MNNEKFKIICNFHGYSDAFIAKELGVCEKTVRNYSSGKTKRNDKAFELAYTLDYLSKREFVFFVDKLVETKILKNIPIFKSEKVFERYKEHLFSIKEEALRMTSFYTKDYKSLKAVNRAVEKVSLKNEGFLNFLKVNFNAYYDDSNFCFFDEKKYLSFIKKEKLKVNRDSLIKFINTQ